MARKPRTWFPGMMYHITNRGNKKAAIFYDKEDHQKYLTYVAEAKALYPFTLHSYCLMYNHIHLLLETHDQHISHIMKYINTYYAIYFNKRHDLNGHVFQGRFDSELITDASYFLNASRYIHLNPIEAGLTEFESLQDYPWSSFSSFLSSTKDPLVTSERVLSFFQEPQLENYLQFLLASIKEAELCRS
jgi:putative transposase